MKKAIFILCLALSTFTSYGNEEQEKFSPIEILYFSDTTNICGYYSCVLDENGNYTLAFYDMEKKLYAVKNYDNEMKDLNF